MLVLNLFYREAYTGDEGFYGVTALNLLHSPTYWLRPSYHPDGNFLADQGAFAHPPFNSYFYALALWASQGRLGGAEAVNCISFVLLLWFAYRLLCLFDVQAGRFTLLLLAGSPALLRAYSQLEAEPLMATFGLMALYYALRGGFAAGQKRFLFVAGLCLGIAFGLKLWLCGPFALAIVTALCTKPHLSAHSTSPSRPSAPPFSHSVLLGLLVFGLGAILPAGLHLLAIGWFYPSDLRFWLQDIYFGVFTGAGISGSRLSGAGVSAEWVQPVWYYAALLYRDHFFLVPVLLFGLGSLLREQQLSWTSLPAHEPSTARERGEESSCSSPGPELFWVLLAGIAGLLPLSLVKVKDPLYVLSCAIFLYLLAGSCLAALARRLALKAARPSVCAKFGTAITLVLLLGFPLGYAQGFQPEKITASFVLLHSLVLLLFLAVLWWGRRQGPLALEWSVYAACAAVIAAGFAYHCLTRQPRDRTIARIVQPYLEGSSTTSLSLIASNFKPYQLYTFRRGCYWDELPLPAEPEALLASAPYSQVRAFVFAPEDQRNPQLAPWLRWLETHAVEKTKELDSQLRSASGFRVFVR